MSKHNVIFFIFLDYFCLMKLLGYNLFSNLTITNWRLHMKPPREAKYSNKNRNPRISHKKAKHLAVNN
jgi:hypothetical protein